MSNDNSNTTSNNGNKNTSDFGLRADNSPLYSPGTPRRLPVKSR